LLTDSGHVGVGSGGSDSAQLIIGQFGSFSDTGSAGFAIGAASGASGTVVVNGGRLTNTDVLTIGDGGLATGVLMIEGGGTVIGSYASGGPAADIDGANASGTVTGSGSMWNLTGSGQQLIVGDAHAGALSVLNGGTVNAGNDTIDIGNQNGGNGTVIVGGSNALLEGGPLVIGLAPGSAGTLTINTGGSVNATSVHLGAAGQIVLAGGTLDPPATILIDAGGTISGFGTIDGGLTGGGAVIASGGLLEVTGSVASGQFTVSNGATLQMDGSVSSGATIGFAGTSGVLALGNGGFSGTLSRFLQGDSIVLTGVANVSTVTIAPPGTLDIQLAGGGDIFIPLDNTFDYAGGTFNVFSSGGTTTITDNVTPCYLAGTLIRTDRGEIRVEDLSIGDKVVTLDGTAKPIRWIGKRAYASAFAAGNRDIVPILIKRGALGENVPVRDLYVSPLHAMYFDGVLVQAEHLVNGHSVVRCPEIDPIRYFHIELDAHDIVFADGAPAETFVDCDSRGMFHNAPEFAALYPDAAPAVWA
jgi:T5SS/PEP-CTERM-associated repeat protein